MPGLEVADDREGSRLLFRKALFHPTSEPREKRGPVNVTASHWQKVSAKRAERFYCVALVSGFLAGVAWCFFTFAFAGSVGPGRLGPSVGATLWLVLAVTLTAVAAVSSVCGLAQDLHNQQLAELEAMATESWRRHAELIARLEGEGQRLPRPDQVG